MIDETEAGVISRAHASDRTMVENDNDFFGTGGPRANAFGWDAHGVLEDLVNGGEVGYSETVRWVIDQANPPAEIAPLVVSILLHARPGQ